MVPKLDRTIGISAYSTKTDGTGGRIRVSKDKFFVSEVLRKKTLGSVSESGSYAVFRLKKSGIDTNHALSEIHQKYGLRLKALGLKDANATTEQFVCETGTSRKHDRVETNRYSLEKIGYVKKPLTKRDMVGNRFRIAIDDVDFAKVSAFDQYDKILNFYGYQRFGSKRPVSHLVGRSIVMKDFEGAVEVLLSGTSEYDLPENNSIREELKDSSNYSKMFARMPLQMDVERAVLGEMIKHGSPVRALHAIPLSLRRFFVEAYQSYIFNRTISMAYEMGEDLSQPHQGDVCYDKDDNLGRYQNDPDQKLAVPLVGYSYSKKNRFDYQISKVLEEEGTNQKDFFVKEMQEVSGEGGFRQSLIQCRDFSAVAPFVSFTLSRGSYATMILREIIKPENPVTAGF